MEYAPKVPVKSVSSTATPRTASPLPVRQPPKEASAPARPLAPAALSGRPPAEGRPLPSSLRERFEQLFGADFSDVRAQEDPSIPRGPLRAFARGANLHFARNRFRPGTPDGDALIGHELAHVIQQREGRARSEGGEAGPFDTSPALEREAHALGTKAARGEPVAVGPEGAHPRAMPAAPPVQAGLFDMLGKANPRLYAPTWLGGHSTEHLEEREHQGRSGPMDLLGPANPRLYLPTALGGHSEEHLKQRREQRRSGPMDLLGPLNPREHLPTILGGHSEEHMRERAVEGRSGPLDLLGPLNPRQYLPTSLGGHTHKELARRMINGTDDALTRLPKTVTGKGLALAGRASGRRDLEDRGKELQGMHRLKFVTWKHSGKSIPRENLPPIPGQQHMTVKFGRGEEGHYEDFRQGSAEIPDDRLAPVSAVNKITGQLENKRYWKLAHGTHTPAEHHRRFSARKGFKGAGATPYRHDTYDSLQVHVSSNERRKIQQRIAQRRRQGVFHLYGEAPHPDLTRCMTPLEQLAQMRGQEVNGFPTEIAEQFQAKNPETARALKTNVRTQEPDRPNAHDPYWDENHDVGPY